MKNLDKVRETIVDSAAELFARYGYEKTSVDDIANMAHKAKASVYYHFKSKVDIFRTVLSDELGAVRCKLETVVGKYMDERQRLANYLTERMTCFREAKVYRQYLITALIHGKDEVTEAVTQVRGEFDAWEYRYFEKICSEGKSLGIFTEAVVPEAFAQMMLVLLKGIEIQLFHSDNYDAMRSTYDAIVKLLVYSSYLPSEEKKGKQHEIKTI